MPRRPNLRPLALLAFATLALLARGDETPPSRFVNEIQQIRNSASYVANCAGEYSAHYARFAEVAQAELDALTIDAQTISNLYDDAIAAYEHNDPVAGQKAWSAAENLAWKYRWCDSALTWEIRFETRRRQMELIPPTNLVVDIVGQSNPESIDDANALIELRRQASEAWGLVADAQVPDPAQVKLGQLTPAINKDKLRELTDAANAAEIHAEMAGWRHEWHRNLYRDILQNRQLTSPDLAANLATLRDIEQQRLTLREEDIARQAKARHLEAQRKELLGTIQHNYAAAQARVTAKNP